MEAAEVMSLPEGSLIVFSRGLRHVVQDSRSAVFDLLPILPTAPEAVAAHRDTKRTPAAAVKREPQMFW
jgi:hypothetical protein